MTTTEYIRSVKEAGWPSFERRVWQRGYYERIIRDEQQLSTVRRYIANNPDRAASECERLDALLLRMERRTE